MSHIDSIDERILGELQANGRLTMKALAERVELSSPAMIERVRRLEDRGVITGYRAIVAPESLGRGVTAVIMVRLAAVDSGFDELIQGNTAIVEAHRLAGRWTHLLRVHIAGLAELEGLLDALHATGATCESSIVTSSPLAWREMTPASNEERVRSGRRGRASVSDPEAADEAATLPRRRGPGRPRIRSAGV